MNYIDHMMECYGVEKGTPFTAEKQIELIKLLLYENKDNVQTLYIDKELRKYVMEVFETESMYSSINPENANFEEDYDVKIKHFCSNWHNSCESANNSNCYFKQLAHKTQECEELKRKVELMMDCADCKVDKYKQALDEIEKELKEDIYCENQECGCDDFEECLKCTKEHILDIINKAKGEG